ncbi:hypothetical protein HW555_008837 [Spodoptera exigua]|uniref:Kelch domain-containing protein 4 n=1 Tax=Spodoptera exigua TaxID=7107 RepID=A0A835L7F8_SPOEX|nr:hypothetical protein HW555_008837 [Spodoptera exigua]
MGKKKNKNKVSGAVKTAAKTEKKLANKLKKELANLGEEDIAKVIAEIEREEAKRSAATEKALPGPPSPRAYATLTPHPTNNELILFGGEYHNGQKTEVYNELLFYNPTNNSWKVLKAPGAPPPRSAHQTIATPANKYVVAPNGPSPRSGHRMALLGRNIIVFGGYADDGRECRYFDDVYSFCLDTRTWSKLAPSGRGPTARSACVMLPAGNDSLLIYGGFSRVREGRSERTHTHTDLFRLSCKVGGGWVWRSQTGGPAAPPARAGQAAAVNPHSNRGYVFGGVSDVEETEEELRGEMSDDLQLLDMETGKWHIVTLRSELQGAKPAAKEEEPAQKEEETVTAAGGPRVAQGSLGVGDRRSVHNEVGWGRGAGDWAPGGGPAGPKSGPGPRMSAMMAVQRATLYVYGGVLEKEEKQFYLSDMYSLDLHKLNDWKTLIEQPSLPDWLGSDSEDEETGSDSESESDSDSD